MRMFEYPTGASARACGRAHGEQFRGEIQSLAALRTYLTARVGGFPDESSVLAAAALHVPVLERYDRALYDEFIGIAEGADLSPAQVVVINHYTDLRDLAPERAAASVSAQDAAAEAKTGDPGDLSGGCSILWTQTETGPILAQTWDMHATAIPYVMMLRVPARAQVPEMWLFTLTGCLGMTGLSTAGVGIAINNLHSTDARVGIVWPALVRKVLCEHSARAGCEVVMQSPIGSGHHYLVADTDQAFGIETSGQLREVLFDSAAPGASASYIHTNHCLAPKVAAASRVPVGSTTHDRYDRLGADIAARPVTDVHDAWQRLGSHEGYPRSVCTNMATPQNPHGAATCGAVAMELGQRGLWAQGGFIHNVAPERFEFREAT